MRIIPILLAATVLLAPLASAAEQFAADQSPARWGDWPLWGDQKDGTYRNPVLPGDYSDLDCIRVGDDYYAISSTFQYSPGMIVLRSRDLVNWRIIGHVVSTSLGEPYRFAWGDYRGERIGLFSYNTSGETGNADFGSFTYRYDSALTR